MYETHNGRIDSSGTYDANRPEPADENDSDGDESLAQFTDAERQYFCDEAKETDEIAKQTGDR